MSGDEDASTDRIAPSRKDFPMNRMFAIPFAFLFLCVPAFAGDAAKSGAAFTESRLNDRILVLKHAPWAETLTVLDAGPGLVVVDTWGSPSAARAARARIDSLFRKPVLWVINTHHHWDHCFGNAAFAGPGTRIAGHRFCAADMRAAYADSSVRKRELEESVALSDHDSIRRYIREAKAETAGNDFRLCPPEVSIGDRDTLRAGNLTLHVAHTPGVHTRSLITVFVPELGVVFARREFASSRPLVLEPGADPARIASVLEAVLGSGTPVRWLVPGHGDAVENPDLGAGLASLKAAPAGAAP
jgi:glyoxylase-like metal-dependent hydrolase (beta-lactamase superfamily II)